MAASAAGWLCCDDRLCCRLVCQLCRLALLRRLALLPACLPALLVVCLRGGLALLRRCRSSLPLRLGDFGEHDDLVAAIQQGADETRQAIAEAAF